MNPNLKRNLALFLVLDWIAEITAHIPNKGEQLACLCVFARRQAPPDRDPPEKEITFHPPEEDRFRNSSLGDLQMVSSLLLAF